jgi:hypothetical protein
MSDLHKIKKYESKYKNCRKNTERDLYLKKLLYYRNKYDSFQVGGTPPDQFLQHVQEVVQRLHNAQSESEEEQKSRNELIQLLQVISSSNVNVQDVIRVIRNADELLKRDIIRLDQDEHAINLRREHRGLLNDVHELQQNLQNQQGYLRELLQEKKTIEERQHKMYEDIDDPRIHQDQERMSVLNTRIEDQKTHVIQRTQNQIQERQKSAIGLHKIINGVELNLQQEQQKLQNKQRSMNLQGVLQPLLEIEQQERDRRRKQFEEVSLRQQQELMHGPGASPGAGFGAASTGPPIQQQSWSQNWKSLPMFDIGGEMHLGKEVISKTINYNQETLFAEIYRNRYNNNQFIFTVRHSLDRRDATGSAELTREVGNILINGTDITNLPMGGVRFDSYPNRPTRIYFIVEFLNEQQKDIIIRNIDNLR